MPTTAWIFISALTAAISYVALTLLYLFVMPSWVSFANTVNVVAGATTPGLNTLTSYETSNINAAFIILAIGIFVFMYLAPFQPGEPTSLAYDLPQYALNLVPAIFAVALLVPAFLAHYVEAKLGRFGKKRRGIVPALAIFLLTIFFIGVVLIILDQIMQPSFAWASTNYPSGVYDPLNFAFLQEGWKWFGLACILIPLSIWLILRVTEEDQSFGGSTY